MIVNPSTKIKQYLLAGEKVNWIGQPAYTGAARSMRPILKLVGFLGIVFLAIALYQFYMGAVVQQPNPGPPFTMDDLARGLQNGSFSIIMAVFFLIFRMFLPRVLKEENNTIYAVTNQRVLIVEHGSPSPIKAFGPGDVSEPSVKKISETVGDVLFSEEVQQVGSFGQTLRRHIAWEGFRAVQDYKGAKKALEEWLGSQKGPRILLNADFRLELHVPREWTLHGLFIEKPLRDNLMFAVIAGILMEGTHLLQDPKLYEQWNTLILTYRAGSHAAEHEAHIQYFIILIEAAKSDNPIDGVEMVQPLEAVNFYNYLKTSDILTRALQKKISICQFGNLFTEGEKSQVKVHASATEYKTDSLRSYQLSGAFNIMGSGILFSQVYSFQQPVHLRYTYLSPGPKKEHEKYERYFNDIVKSVQIYHTDKDFFARKSALEERQGQPSTSKGGRAAQAGKGRIIQQ